MGSWTIDNDKVPLGHLHTVRGTPPRCASCRRAVVPSCRRAVVPSYRCAVVPLCRRTVVPLYRCTVVPLCRRRSVLARESRLYASSRFNIACMSHRVQARSYDTSVPGHMRSLASMPARYCLHGCKYLGFAWSKNPDRPSLDIKKYRCTVVPLYRCTVVGACLHAKADCMQAADLTSRA